VEFHSHPIRLLGLGVSNNSNTTVNEEPGWTELELEFEPWPDDDKRFLWSPNLNEE